MRINVYSQELAKEVKLVEKRAETGIVHYGVRIYLAYPGILHNTPDDDDRSAITFWVSQPKDGMSPSLWEILHDAARKAALAADETVLSGMADYGTKRQDRP